MKKIGLSTSTDQGRTWSYAGDLLTSDNSTERAEFHNYFDYGVGEPNLYVDTAGGYFYVWFMNTWFDTRDSQEFASSLRVARSPISAKMAPGSWKYFYQNGWSQDGHGSRSSDVLPNVSSRTCSSTPT
jgi:hypothetical protein